MVYETPEISNEVKNYLDSDNYRDRPILKNYPNFQDCFVCFHPFLIIKAGHNDQIKFETENWPNKSTIISTLAIGKSMMNKYIRDETNRGPAEMRVRICENFIRITKFWRDFQC